MTYVIELADDEHAALIEFLVRNGVQPDYASAYQSDLTPIGRAFAKLDRPRSAAVEALKQVSSILGKRDPMSNAPARAAEVADAALLLLGHGQPGRGEQ